MQRGNGRTEICVRPLLRHIADIQHSGRTLVTEVLTGELQSELLSEWRKGHRNSTSLTDLTYFGQLVLRILIGVRPLCSGFAIGDYSRKLFWITQFYIFFWGGGVEFEVPLGLRA